jgi:hypothetical protein
VGGVDLNKSRIRAALAAVLALPVTSAGFTVAEFTAKVHTMTGDSGWASTPPHRQHLVDRSSVSA